jgi:hypothetical protein
MGLEFSQRKEFDAFCELDAVGSGDNLDILILQKYSLVQSNGMRAR